MLSSSGSSAYMRVPLDSLDDEVDPNLQENIKRLKVWATSQRDDVYSTSLTTLGRECGLDRDGSFRFARQLEALRCATFARRSRGKKRTGDILWVGGLRRVVGILTSRADENTAVPPPAVGDEALYLDTSAMIEWIGGRLRCEGTEIDEGVLDRIFDLELDFMRSVGIVD